VPDRLCLADDIPYRRLIDVSQKQPPSSTCVPGPGTAGRFRILITPERASEEIKQERLFEKYYFDRKQ